MKKSSHQKNVDFFRLMLERIGEDPLREGLRDTPKRVFKAYGELLKGYKESPEKILKSVFKSDTGGMVVLKNIEFYSLCEHHILPFFGRVNVGYIPDGRVVGISKLARLVEIYSRRLQIQERLTDEIADAIMIYLQPKGAMVTITAQHLCMIARGVEKQHSIMTTSSIRGIFEKNLTPRKEFLNLVGR